MALTRERANLLLISSLGCLLMVPWELFLGVMFTFDFSSHESRWAWSFDVVAFWLQIPAIVVSFFLPRMAGRAMFVLAGLSLIMGTAFELKDMLAPTAALPGFHGLPRLLEFLVRTLLLFWGLPFAFASLLLWAARAKEKDDERLLTSE